MFIFNFHPEDSYESHCIGVEEAGEYQACQKLSVSFPSIAVLYANFQLHINTRG